MIYSLIHPGSGLGNQLHRIIAGKVLALDKGYEYSAIGREHFKGKFFIKVGMGIDNHVLTLTQQPSGKLIVAGEPNLWEEKTNYYNPEFNFIEDNTIIDGEFQDERYFGHRMKEIDEWLKVEPIEIADNWCVIGFRGGEYSLFPELFLTKEYWDDAIKLMREINPGMLFRVETDDPELAKQFFPKFPVMHDIGENWRSMRYAKYAIIANSSFYILPRLLKHSNDCKYNDGTPKYCQHCPSVTIAPRYWARHNIKEWSRPDNYYKSFLYV